MKCAENPELRFILCNTTEAGIRYDAECKFEDKPGESYPAKLTQFMYHRFETFGKEEGKGFIILSCELIDDNGKELEKCVLKHAADWNLGETFTKWIKKANLFCSTLVDRIVTGYPRSDADNLNQENGYIDKVLNTGEIFGFWVIEGPQSIKEEFPCDAANLPILITDDHKPYKQRKVRIFRLLPYTVRTAWSLNASNRASLACIALASHLQKKISQIIMQEVPMKLSGITANPTVVLFPICSSPAAVLRFSQKREDCRFGMKLFLIKLQPVLLLFNGHNQTIYENPSPGK